MPDLIFTGKCSIDTKGGQTHYRLARFLGISVVNNVSSLLIKEDMLLAESEFDNGETHVIEPPLPCVIGASKGLNEPRYATFRDIMKAKKRRSML